MSRPRSSVPNQWAALGAVLMASDCVSGFWIGRTLARTAARMLTATHPAQTQKNQPSRFRRRLTWVIAATAPPAAASAARVSSTAIRWVSSGNGDPRVDDGEQEVDDEVEDDHRHGDEQDDALHHDVVALVDGHHQLVPEAGELEEELDDEGAGDEAADVDAGGRQQ